MSRIHDALKRAEQEKVASSLHEGATAGSRAAPGTDQREPAQTLGSENMGILPVGAELTPEVSLLRDLLEHCPQCSWSPDPKTMLLFDGQNHVLGTEEFRTLRSRLYLSRKERPLQKLLITSPLPKEGKTFTAVNLARVIAQQRERRVLLIDADMRSSRLHAVLGAPSTPGLSDYLSAKAGEFSVVQRGPEDNFFFIPGGQLVRNPSELIGSGRLKLLLNRLGPAFDWIILDSPPVIPVSDAKMLADICDGVLILIQAGVTPFNLAHKACQGFRDRCLLGVVLNGVNPGSAYSSYYYTQAAQKLTK